jgi:hypothetical protein
MEDMLRFLTPSLNPTRNEGRTVAGRDQARHQPSISFVCDYRATTRRKRDFAFWHFGLTVPPTLLAIVDEVIE